MSLRLLIKPTVREFDPPGGKVLTYLVFLYSIIGQEEFTDRDVEVFRRYLTFCGIGENSLRSFPLRLTNNFFP